MEMERDELTVREILDLKNNGMLRANPEYQRGAVWTAPQQKKLVDSVFRGYPLPLIYLHHIRKTVAGMVREDLEIIDGQQRINALFDFQQGAFKLFDPKLDEREAKFPKFVLQQACPWGRKDWATLDDALRGRFESTKLSVVRVTTENENEARDLFIRLQAGLPLNSQESRDAWPGAITEVVLKLGGKAELARYPGHEFFTRVLKMKPKTDRGKTRQLAAQLLSLYMTRRRTPGIFADINSKAIDEFYYVNIELDPGSPELTRFNQILDFLVDVLGGQGGLRLKGHDAIHLVLLVDTLWESYTRSWVDRLPDALHSFLERFALGKSTKDHPQPDEYWTQYGQWTRVNSDKGDRIGHRHSFYVQKMTEFLGPLVPKDAKRLFDANERELVYYRDSRKCQVCGGVVSWDDSEVHHVVEHAKGGSTSLDNAALVHKHCHPKGKQADEFAAKWASKRG